MSVFETRTVWTLSQQTRSDLKFTKKKSFSTSSNVLNTFVITTHQNISIVGFLSATTSSTVERFKRSSFGVTAAAFFLTCFGN